MTQPAGPGGLVLVVEDERPIADLVRLYLGRDGFGVHVETTGEAGLDAARRLRPVACIVDIGLPGAVRREGASQRGTSEQRTGPNLTGSAGAPWSTPADRPRPVADGIELVRRLREGGDWTPVIFLTARDDEVDRIVGLELGADDYVTKPFSPRELVARVRAVLRRVNGVPDAALGTRRVGVVELDPARRRVWADGVDVALTSTEFDLLAHLMARPGRVFTREELLSAVWGYAALGPGHAHGAPRAGWSGTRTVDVHVAQVRGKLDAASPLARDVIRTVRGVGYTADEPDVSPP